jgi:hypothetical protein
VAFSAGAASDDEARHDPSWRPPQASRFKR